MKSLYLIKENNKDVLQCLCNGHASIKLLLMFLTGKSQPQVVRIDSYEKTGLICKYCSPEFLKKTERSLDGKALD